jgi:uncharacterized repeat protein (TIGR02543 family)
VYFLGNKPTIENNTFSGVTGATAYISSIATGYPAVGDPMNGLTVALGKFTLTYDTNGGIAMLPGVVLQGLAISKPTMPKRSNYNFAGWSASAGGTTLKFPYTPSIAGDITLFAKWNAKIPTATATATATRTATRTLRPTNTPTRTKTPSRTRTATRTP